ncbi:MAG TPA: histidine kinase [Chryseolinea sp.]
MVITREVLIRELKFAGAFIAASIVQTYFSCRGCSTFREYALISFFTLIMWILLWRGNSLLTDFVDSKVSWYLYPTRRLVVGLISTIVYTIIAVVTAMITFEKLVSFNFGSSFTWTIYFSVIITIIISLILHSREFLLRGRQATLDKEIYQKESIRAKYEALKSQLSPHFLFNSLNALTNLVYEDQDKAAKFIKQLSEVYRYVLDTRNVEVVPIEDEKRFLNSYLFLQQIRFGDKLKLEVDLDKTRTLVAPLVLQMLVENAIKHNVISEEDPLHIRIFQQDGYIVVENDLRRKSVLIDDSPGVGLDNILRRYEFLSDKKIEVVKNGKFTVRLPIIPE